MIGSLQPRYLNRVYNQTISEATPSNNHQSLNSNLLWRQMQEGSQEAFAALFKSYYPDLKAYGAKMSGREDLAKEGIQLLFVKIWERKHQLSIAQNPKAYLLKSYRSILLDLIAKEQKRNRQQTEIALQFSPQEFPFFQNSSSAASSSIHDFINQLSEKQREIIYLKFYNNLSYQEIAEVLSINYQTVRNYMVKALTSLRKKMNFSSKK